MELADRWAIRYYEWSCKQAEEESRSDFPLLSHVLGTSAWRLIEYWGTLNSPARERLPRALVKRFNARALSLIGDTIDAQEIKLIDGYLNYDKVLDSNGAARGMRAYASEKERIFNEQIDTGIAKRGNRRLIREMATKRLGGAAGPR